MDFISDARIIGRSNRNPSAFAAIFDRHASVLHGYLCRRVGSDDAEDLVSETFLIAFRARATFDRTRSSALPWLYGIAANLVLKRHRSLGRHQRAVDRLMMLTPVSTDFEERFTEDNANAWKLAQLSEVIELLPPMDREVLVLYAWQRLSYADIAQALDLPVGTVRSRLNRVRTKLREPRPAGGKEPADQVNRAPGGAWR